MAGQGARCDGEATEYRPKGTGRRMYTQRLARDTGTIPPENTQPTVGKAMDNPTDTEDLDGELGHVGPTKCDGTQPQGDKDRAGNRRPPRRNPGDTQFWPITQVPTKTDPQVLSTTYQGDTKADRLPETDLEMKG